MIRFPLSFTKGSSSVLRVATMPTPAEAKEHIESFWTRRHIARNAVDLENDINIRDLSNGLKMLLYTYPLRSSC